jgi:hypothetical protein
MIPEGVSFFDAMRLMLPLRVDHGVLRMTGAQIWGRIPGAGLWGLSVEADRWTLARRGKAVLTQDDAGYEDNDERLAFMAGLSMVDIVGGHPEGADPLFVFTEGFTLRVWDNPDGWESYVLDFPWMAFVR